MSSRAILKIGILMGGISAEREVSLSSGAQCQRALCAEGFEVVPVDPCAYPGAALAECLAALAPDVVFNALHGRWGEDGTVQGVLEWLRLPYTHSGVLASALAMDKSRSKEMFRAAGIPVAQSLLASRQDAAARHLLPAPYVVKPNNEGSSVGIYIVREGANDPPRLGPELPEQVLVESYAPGRELTTTVLGDRALGVTEIFVDGWYDYDAKYTQGGSRHVVPACVPDEIASACERYALMAHEVLGCRGISRTDFRWDDSRGLEGLIVLETNTQPGMTPTSLAPEQAAHAGISFPSLCRWLVEDASCAR